MSILKKFVEGSLSVSLAGPARECTLGRASATSLSEAAERRKSKPRGRAGAIALGCLRLHARRCLRLRTRRLC